MMKGNILGAMVVLLSIFLFSVSLVLHILLLIIMNAVITLQSGPGVTSEIQATTERSRPGVLFNVVPHPPPVTTPMNKIKPP